MSMTLAGWIYEGETSDGTVLSTCPTCHCVVTERNIEKHNEYHLEVHPYRSNRWHRMVSKLWKRETMPNSGYGVEEVTKDQADRFMNRLRHASKEGMVIEWLSSLVAAGADLDTATWAGLEEWDL